MSDQFSVLSFECAFASIESFTVDEVGLGFVNSSVDQVTGGGEAVAGSASDPSGALPLPEALSRELGLRLKKLVRPGPVLVIDHVEEKPTEN